ncbi:MAG: hypothetical protein KDK36_21815 [Leptospiraceae bacterium]|nr:hypothetical protein [Leptospiraceae bacterium]
MASKENKTSQVLPSHFGFYNKISDHNGWGIKANTYFLSLFRGSIGLINYQSHLFYSHKWDYFYISLGVGPSFSLRGNESSPVSTTGIGSIGIEKESWAFGITGTAPGKFSYKAYRDSDPLEEKLPETIAIGFSYYFSEYLTLYLEARKAFYEKSYFRLSKLDELPNLDRGLGAEGKVSGGFEFKLKTESLWKFRMGMEAGGKYNSKGQNLRGAGLGLGLSYFPNPENKAYFISVSMLNYSIFSKKGARNPENFYYLGGGYLW